MTEYDIAVTMAMTLGTMIAGIGGLALLQTKKKGDGSSFLPIQQPSKRAYELYVLTYTPIWILAFGCIVAFGWYQDFDEWSYMKVCVGLALPFLLQPFLLPSAGFGSPDEHRPLTERYAFKANLWIAVYSFIGNYWYTHCKCRYSVSSHAKVFMTFSGCERCF
jgi:cycloeucalenol cycloisomerase